MVRARASRGFDSVLLSSSVSPRRPYCNGTVLLHIEPYIELCIELRAELYTELYIELRVELYIELCVELRAELRIGLVTATQSIEALVQYIATMQACTIGSLWTRISR